ncbi:MAG TPA: ferritin-like domain-containing protein [Dehalococcoidia bacterium]|jgi:rubrerythrin|nr:ferritin-like domain-containing protein [Dehalococcoidia bacterium]
MRHAFARSAVSEESLFDVLTRLWQIKLQSIDLLERWTTSVKDTDIKAGISVQLADERRHLRLLADEIRRRGGRQPSTVDHVVTKAFAIVQAQPNDLMKLCALHRGIKTSTNDRCYRLISLADAALCELLEGILQDEERHLRWADIRLRSISGEDVRRCNVLLEKMSDATGAVWSRPWRHLSPSRLSYLG